MQTTLRYDSDMAERTGTERPGGRTARTRRAVHAGLRAILAEGGDATIPAVAARSGVHATTIYRRWGTIESLMLEVAVEDVNAGSPVPVTGDLEANLGVYTRHLLAGIRAKGRAPFFQILVSVSHSGAGAEDLAGLIAPRLDQFQKMLDAAGITRIDAMRLVEIVVAPAYFWAELGVPLDPDRDSPRLVETALLASREGGRQ